MCLALALEQAADHGNRNANDAHHCGTEQAHEQNLKEHRCIHAFSLADALPRSPRDSRCASRPLTTPSLPAEPQPCMQFTQNFRPA